MKGVKKWGKVGGSGIYTSIHRTIFFLARKDTTFFSHIQAFHTKFFLIFIPFC
jgi:hypothetical protein